MCSLRKREMELCLGAATAPRLIPKDVGAVHCALRSRRAGEVECSVQDKL